jgi:glycosyltransferase involved in cell wall biosynthesis
VSVGIVTCRADFADDALANFKRQTYPRLELIVVVNGGALLAQRWQALAAGSPETRICHAPDVTLGACRNLSVATARGEFVAMFDDDDLYGPEYVSEAIAVLRGTGAAMVTKVEYLWIDGVAGIFRYSRQPGAVGRSFTDVSGSTQVFRRCWHVPESGAAYSDTTCGEDYAFSRAVAAQGGLIVASGPGHYIRRRNMRPDHVHAWNGRLGKFRLEEHERLQITTEQACGLAGISGG